MSNSGDSADPLPEPSGRPHLDHEFHVETEFFDELAELIPSAALRTAFYERAIRHQLDRILTAVFLGRPVPVPVFLQDGYGLMITERSYPNVPECLIAFEYAVPPAFGTRVIFYRVWLAPELEESEDESADP